MLTSHHRFSVKQQYQALPTLPLCALLISPIEYLLAVFIGLSPPWWSFCVYPTYLPLSAGKHRPFRWFLCPGAGRYVYSISYVATFQTITVTPRSASNHRWAWISNYIHTKYLNAVIIHAITSSQLPLMLEHVCVITSHRNNGWLLILVHVKQRDVIIHTCHNFSDVLVISPLQSEYGEVIISHAIQRMGFLIFHLCPNHS